MVLRRRRRRPVINAHFVHVNVCMSIKMQATGDCALQELHTLPNTTINLLAKSAHITTPKT